MPEAVRPPTGAAREALDAVFAVLDRRLNRAGAAPIGVAFSGGGDSLMALKAAKAWAERHDRSVIAFHVDHGVQTLSGGWARSAERAAEQLGVRFTGLLWDGAKPTTGLAAAARQARHRLIAEAARKAGVRVLVVGHTADDQIEAGLMRAAGHRMGDLREWSPSPVWPEGRGLFHLRPLLGLRRAAIREHLAAEGEHWIDDPMNQHPGSPRARVRPLAALAEAPCPHADEAGLSRLAGSASVGLGGDIRIDRQILRAAPHGLARRLIGAAATCVGGQAGPARARRLDALTDRLASAEPFVGVLSGAKVLASSEVVFVRNAGEAVRGGLASFDLRPGEAQVWDGRFEIAAREPATVARLAGRATTLDRAQRERLKSLPAPVRPGLPVIMRPDRPPICPILAEDGAFEVNLLVADRFDAACGVISKEPAT